MTDRYTLHEQSVEIVQYPAHLFSVSVMSSEQAIHIWWRTCYHRSWQALHLSGWRLRLGGKQCIIEVKSLCLEIIIALNAWILGGEVPRLVAVEGEVADDGRYEVILSLLSSWLNLVYIPTCQFSCLPPPRGWIAAPVTLLSYRCAHSGTCTKGESFQPLNFSEN